jgi:hypothetical protein
LAQTFRNRKDGVPKQSENMCFGKTGDSMKGMKPISATMVGLVLAVIYGGATLLCGPAVLFFLTAGGVPRLDADPTDVWATVAVLAPLAAAAIGFLSGVLMASMFNLFARQVPEPALARVVAIRSRSRGASAGESNGAGFSVRGQEQVING